MNMSTLNAENRAANLKPKQLRRTGIIPGVLYGKNLDESLSIQFSQSDVARFLKSNAAGSRAELAVAGKKHLTLLREVTYKPTTDEAEHLSFQTLLADELVTSTARIVLLNREKIAEMIQQTQDEIPYRALPAHMIERIEIDLEGMKVGDSVRIEDLDIAKNPDIEILTPLDTLLVAIVESRIHVELAEEEDEQSETEAEAEAEAE